MTEQVLWDYLVALGIALALLAIGRALLGLR
jgi:hypothetical protein